VRTAPGAVSLIGGARVAAAAATLLLAACGTTAATVAPAHPEADREWLDNARSFIETLDADVSLSAAGGANLATARRALGDESDVYSMLVAYDLFGDCGPALANLGTASARVASVEQALIGACGRLENASTLFERAMRGHDPHPLLAASRMVLSAVPLLFRASAALAALPARG
jgi:hypothetical protein